MKKIINITDCSFDTERYRDGAEAADAVQKLGFDGLELMHCQGYEPDFFLPGSVIGVHLRCKNEWVDLWKGDMKALEREYDTLEQAAEVFGGLDRESLLAPLREDLELARRLGASYVVFHVSDVKMTELFSYTFRHTDEEVVDAAAEVINTLLDGQGYEFEFLMENLWWPGLTMTRPEITERLFAAVHYSKKGIMLDTGHLMHTNLELRSEEEAVDYIKEQVLAHGEMARNIRGIHLNQSITGDYVKRLLSRQSEMPENHRERVNVCYNHVFQIDRHLPFSTPRVRELTELVQPEYLTFEFITESRKEHEKKLRQQMEALYDDLSVAGRR